MNLRAKQRTIGSLICVGIVLVSGCSSATKENEAVRANNCALIADWNVYANDPSTDYSQGNVNSYESESLKEDLLWSKLQSGDKSYDAFLELRKLSYSNHYWIAPPMGEKVTLENRDSFTSDEDLFDEDASWKIIENVRASCPSFPKDYLAEMFAPVLLM